MKATQKFYARPDKAPTTEVVPVLANHAVDGDRGVNLRFIAVGESAASGEMHVRMSSFEALSLAAEIVLKVARAKVF